jgi:DNA-binding sugar fermentation-stimulating protein
MSSGVVYSYGSLIDADFFERTNRFECKVKGGDEAEMDVYCPNTGSMLSLVPTSELPLRKCVLSTSTSSTRKHTHTLEAVQEAGALVGIHSRLANDMVDAALKQSLVAELQGYTELNREVTSAPSAKNKKDGNSRTDFELVWRVKDDEATNPFADFAYGGEGGEEGGGGMAKKKGTKKEPRNASDKGVTCRMLVEVKSVTLSLDSDEAEYGKRNAQFPDCVSTRASKHLRSLMDHLHAAPGAGSDPSRKDRAMVFFLIQRDDVDSFSPCHLDKAYTAQLELAIEAGVEVLCYTTKLDPATGDVTWGSRVQYKANPLPPASPSSEAEAARGGRKRKR